jgi:hypothetical protein
MPFIFKLTSRSPYGTKQRQPGSSDGKIRAEIVHGGREKSAHLVVAVSFFFFVFF